MPQRKTQIQVPERGEHEADATTQQLQFIRQLVSGMSLRGFRFDYRRLGEDQAASVIDQLLAIRDAAPESGPAKPARGCGGALLGLVKFGVVVVVLLALIAGGVYFASLRGVDLGVDFSRFIPAFVSERGASDREEEHRDTPGDGAAAGDTQPDPGSGKNLVDSELFPGLKIEQNPGDTDRAAQPDIDPLPDDAHAPGTGSANPTGDAAPPTDAISRSDLDAIELMLVRLSQYSRSEYTQAIREKSVQAMNTRLAKWSDTMEAIEQANPELAGRIRAVVERYGRPTVDGEALREEINAIREMLGALKKR